MVVFSIERMKTQAKPNKSSVLTVNLRNDFLLSKTRRMNEMAKKRLRKVASQMDCSGVEPKHTGRKKKADAGPYMVSKYGPSFV